MDILIPILLLIGLYIYMWYASTDVLKGTKMYNNEHPLLEFNKFAKIQWITYIPIVNMFFALIITQIEMVEEMSKMMDGYRTQMESQMKANGKGGK